METYKHPHCPDLLLTKVVELVITKAFAEVIYRLVGPTYDERILIRAVGMEVFDRGIDAFGFMEGSHSKESLQILEDLDPVKTARGGFWRDGRGVEMFRHNDGTLSFFYFETPVYHESA